jgi:phospholipid-binding lipoprotein MlaA
MPTRSRGSSNALALGIAALLATTALSGCATPPTDPAQRAEFDRINDPLEPMNRTIFGINQAIDKNAIRPVAVAYRDVVPEFARDGLHNAMQNFGEPVVFLNKVLQGEPVAAAKTLLRFLANSTFGLGGFFDVATPRGVVRQPAGDFGATLYKWGVGEGPYLVLPLLGPSNPRDTVGFAVDSVSSPWGYIVDIPIEASIGQFVAKGIDVRSRAVDATDDLERNSVDYYATLRSVYRQYRQAELDGGAAPSGGDLYTDPAAGGAAGVAPAKGGANVPASQLPDIP